MTYTAHRGDLPRRTALVIAATDTTRRSVSRILARVPFDVSETASPAEGLALAENASPAIVIVEIGAAPSMPVFLGKLRSAGEAPVLLVGADFAEGVGCLEAGVADDYVQSPVWERELRARAVRLLEGRRAAHVLNFGDVVIDVRARVVLSRDGVIKLTSREFDLLAFLAARPDRPFARETLLERVWRSSSDWQRIETVSEHVYRLRRKLEADPSSPQRIITLPGAGYSFRSHEPPDDGGQRSTSSDPDA